MKDAKVKDKPRSDALPSGSLRRTRPKKSTIKSWEEGTCTSTTKLLVGHPDCWAKVAFSRKQWMDIQEKVKNTPDWDVAIEKGWIKANECKGAHASTQYEVCSCSAGIAAACLVMHGYTLTTVSLLCCFAVHVHRVLRS
jgi:hypothetical protein